MPEASNDRNQTMPDRGGATPRPLPLHETVVPPGTFSPAGTHPLPDPGSLPGANPFAITPEEASQAAVELQAFKTLETRSTRKKRSKRLRITLIILAAVIVLAGGAYATSVFLSPQQDDSVDVQPVDYVLQDTYLDTISGSGTVDAVESVVVTPELDGTIAELHVAEGDMVTEGQTLFIIDAPEVDTQIRQAERGVSDANRAYSDAVFARDEAQRAIDGSYNAYKTLEAEIDKARKAAKKAKDPFDEKEAKAQLDAAWAEHEQSKSQLTPAERGIEDANLALGDAQTALNDAHAISEKRTVTAPISGQIVTMNIERGMLLSTLATAGQSPLRIADLSRMRITLNVDESYINGLTLDQAATVTFNALPDYTAEAKVRRIAAVSSSSSGGGDALSGDMYGGMGGGGVTFPVEIIIENPDPRVKIGMSAQAEIITKKLEDVLMVSTLTLQGAEGDSAFVEVQDENGEVRQVQVRILAQNADFAAIEGDLKAGDAVRLFMPGGLGDDGSGGAEVMYG